MKEIFIVAVLAEDDEFANPESSMWNRSFTSLRSAQESCQEDVMELMRACDDEAEEPESWPWEESKKRNDCWIMKSPETSLIHTILRTEVSA